MPLVKVDVLTLVKEAGSLKIILVHFYYVIVFLEKSGSHSTFSFIIVFSFIFEKGFLEPIKRATFFVKMMEFLAWRIFPQSLIEKIMLSLWIFWAFLS